MLRWPRRRLQPTLAKGGTAFLVAYSALAEAAPGSPRLPVADVATPDVDLVGVVRDGVVGVLGGVTCEGGAAAGWDVVLDAVQQWIPLCKQHSADQLRNALRSAQASRELPLESRLALLTTTLLELLRVTPYDPFPDDTIPAVWRRNEATTAVRGAVAAAAALLRPCGAATQPPRGVPPPDWAALHAIAAEPVRAFDAMCDVGDLSHTVRGVLSAAPREWFRVPTYGEPYMDVLSRVTDDTFIAAARNASSRYDLTTTHLGTNATFPQALAAATLPVPGWGRVITPAVLVGSALDGLSSSGMNVHTIRTHPSGDARLKLRRRLARVRHAVAVHQWLRTAPPAQVGALPAGWAGRFTLSRRLLVAAAAVEDAVGAVPLEAAPCFAVLVPAGEGGDEGGHEEDAVYSDEGVECEHPAAYLNAVFLPDLFRAGFPCPTIISYCSPTAAVQRPGAMHCTDLARILEAHK